MDSFFFLHFLPIFSGRFHLSVATSSRLCTTITSWKFFALIATSSLSFDSLKRFSAVFSSASCWISSLRMAAFSFRQTPLSARQFFHWLLFLFILFSLLNLFPVFFVDFWLFFRHSLLIIVAWTKSWAWIKLELTGLFSAEPCPIILVAPFCNLDASTRLRSFVSTLVFC